MLTWLRDRWTARADRDEDIATVRGMLRASEAKNVDLAARVQLLEQHMVDLDEYLQSSVILRRV